MVNVEGILSGTLSRRCLSLYVASDVLVSLQVITGMQHKLLQFIYNWNFIILSIMYYVVDRTQIRTVW